MLRQLLTLLAVISGFTLAAEPVSAAEMRAVSVSAAQAGDDCQHTVAVPVAEDAVAARRSVTTVEFVRPVPAIVSPTVQLKVDRARE